MGESDTIEEFEQILISILDNYLSLGLMKKGFYDEYVRFIKTLIEETNKIIEEKAKREEKALVQNLQG